MPWVEYYKYTEGTRALEFWKIYRGGEQSELVSVPTEWSDDQIKDELEDWCQLQYHNYNVSYGWNDSKDKGKRD